jgi:Winged helix DNA-binding domain
MRERNGLTPKKSSRNHALTVPAEAVLAFRVQRQNLDHKETRALEEISAVCGIHAQVMSAALGQFWARIRGIGPEEIYDGLWKQRSLVKTWCMRGTLHIVPRDDLDVFAGARRRVSTDRETQWMKYVGISYSDLDTVTHAIREALDGKALTRSELMKEIGKHLRPKLRTLLKSSWNELLHPASYEEALCFGPQRGKENTFVSPKNWLKSWRISLTPEQSRSALLERYLRVYGPSDRLEFAAWAGLDPINAKPTWESMLERMTEVAYCGRRTWLLKDDLEDLRRSVFRDPVRLIPNFDVYLAGRDRGVLTSTKQEHKRVYREAGWVSAVILVKGKVGGVWSVKTQRDKLFLSIESFVEFGSDLRRRVEEEAEAYADFLGSSAGATISWTMASPKPSARHKFLGEPF